MPWETPARKEESKTESEVKREEKVESSPSLIRGLEELQLKAKQRDDEAKSAALRGKLIEQIAASKETDESEPSRLRGTLLDKASHETISEAEAKSEIEGSKLRGTLLEKRETPEPYSKEWLVKQTFVQRDSKAEFIYEGFQENKSGERIVLVCPRNRGRLSHNIERLVQRIQTPGEAWFVKER